MEITHGDGRSAVNFSPVLNRQVSNISDVTMDSGRPHDEGNTLSKSEDQPSIETPSQYSDGYDPNLSHVYMGWSEFQNMSGSTPGLTLQTPKNTPNRAESYRRQQDSPTFEQDKAAPIGTSLMQQPFTGHSHDANHSGTLPRQTPEPSPLFAPESVGVDLTTAAGLGPWTHSQRNSMGDVSPEQGPGYGFLARCLGSGFRVDTTIRETDLVKAAPATSNTRQPLSFSKRMSTKLSRSKTVRLAQREADRRGEIIEIIMESPAEQGTDISGFDMTHLGGPSSAVEDLKSPFQPTMRKSTFPTKEEERTQFFYPQPDWKPFVMRGPYLGYLILLALGMGIGTEALYRQSVQRPLLVFKTPGDISPTTYLTLKFAPTVVSVVFGVLWQMTDIEVRRLEPFHQLSKPQGALAEHSISIDYITFISFFRPFRALQYRHYAVFFSSAASLLATTLVPTLGAASIVMKPDRQERLANPGGEKFIIINSVWARCLTSVLVIVAFLGGVLLYVLNTRKSGLSADVKGISGLASMAVVSHILMDFQDMDFAQPKDIHRQLKNRRYALRNSSLTPMDSQPISASVRRRATSLKDSSESRSNAEGISQNPHPLMLRPLGCVSLVGAIVVFFIVVYVVLFTDFSVVTERAPWVVTMLAVCVKMGWGGLDADLRMMEPYHILWRRHASPKTLTLDYTAMPVGWVAVKGLFNQHYLIFLVGIGTVMSEVLTVLATSLATVSGQDFLKRDSVVQTATEEAGTSRTVNAGQETQGSFFTTLVLVSFILVYMAIVAGTVAIRRGRTFLPRQPNTIASVLAFIHQSKMVYDFVGTSKFNRNAMKKRLAEVGKTYGVGWFTGRDGLTHCGVDEEELLGDFVPGHGLDEAKKAWAPV